MAQLSQRTGIFSGDTSVVDSTQQHDFGTRAFDTAGNEYVYMTGIVSTILGNWVTFDELGITTLLVADAKGPVAVAMAIISSTSKFGWYCISGKVEAAITANTSVDTSIGFETTAGYAGDGKGAGDTIYGAFCREAVGGANAIATAQIRYPFVDDNSN